MTKMLVFDMDGTIADLYGVDNWLDDLRNSNARPYNVAKPLVDMDTLKVILEGFKTLGWKIAVTSWLAMGSTKAYDNEVRLAKKNWLDRFDFPYDELHLVKYGTTKANCTRNKADYQILVDDNDNVCKGWNLGGTIDAKKDIIEQLSNLFENIL